MRRKWKGGGKGGDFPLSTQEGGSRIGGLEWDVCSGPFTGVEWFLTVFIVG